MGGRYLYKTKRTEKFKKVRQTKMFIEMGGIGSQKTSIYTIIIISTWGIIPQWGSICYATKYKRFLFYHYTQMLCKFGKNLTDLN
jgi:hypothetical protein